MIKLWLPLSNNARNTGLQLISTTNSGAIASEDIEGCKCHFFNGTSSGIKINTDVISNLSQVSVCFWVYTTGTSVGSAFSFEISQSWQFSCHNGMFSVRDNGSGTGGTRTELSIGNVEANKWNHLCFIYDKGTMSIYKNGTLTASKKTSGTTLNGGIVNNWIGRAVQGGNYFLNGYIRDFRVYDNVLPIQDIERINLDLAYEFNSDLAVNSVTHIKKGNFHQLFATSKMPKNVQPHVHTPYYKTDQGEIYPHSQSIKNIASLKNLYPQVSNYEFFTKHIANFKNSTLIIAKLAKTPNIGESIELSFDAIQLHNAFNTSLYIVVRQGRSKSDDSVCINDKVAIKKNKNEHVKINFETVNSENYFSILLMWRRNYRKTNFNDMHPEWNDIFFKNVTLKSNDNILPQKAFFVDKSALFNNSPINFDRRDRIAESFNSLLINYFNFDDKGEIYSCSKFTLNFYNIIKDKKAFAIKFKCFKKCKKSNDFYKAYEILFFKDSGFSNILTFYVDSTSNYNHISLKTTDNPIHYYEFECSYNDFFKKYHTIILNDDELFFDGKKLKLDNFNDGISKRTKMEFNGVVEYIKTFNKPLSDDYINKLSYTDPEPHETSINGFALENIGYEYKQIDNINHSTVCESKKFAYGDLNGYFSNEHHSFTILTYKFYDEASRSYIKYNNIDNIRTICSEDDAASFYFGHEWSIPSVEDFEVLLEDDVKTIVIRMPEKEDANRAVTGVFFKKGKKKLYFPVGNYLTNELTQDSSMVKCFTIDSNGNIYFQNLNKWEGFYIRPIKKATE